MLFLRREVPPQRETVLRPRGMTQPRPRVAVFGTHAQQIVYRAFHSSGCRKYRDHAGKGRCLRRHRELQQLQTGEFQQRGADYKTRDDMTSSQVVRRTIRE